MNPCPEQGPKDFPTSENLGAIIVLVEGGEDTTVVPYKVSHRYPVYPLPEKPTQDDLAGIVVTVECTGDMTFRPRQPPPPGGEGKAGGEDKPAQ
jgi:hypothetical protein